MKTEILTMLGYSSSLAVAVMTANIAVANAATPISAATVPSSSTLTKIPISRNDAQFLDPMSDAVGDLAISKLGCDCPGCRTQVIQQAQAGQL